MSIEFQCNQCSKTLRVATSSAGKKCKCPACAALLTIPYPSSSADSSVATSTRADQSRSGNVPSKQTDEADDDAFDLKIEIACPKCSTILLYAPELDGTRGLCKGCGHIFTLSHDSLETEREAKSFPFQCPKCSHLFEGKPEMEGRRGKCTECQSVFTIQKLKTDKQAAAPSRQALPAAAKSKTTPTSSASTPSAIPAVRPTKPVRPAPAAIPTAIPTAMPASPYAAIPQAVPQNPFGQNANQPGNASAWDAVDLSPAAWPSPQQQASPYAANPYAAGNYATSSQVSPSRAVGSRDTVSIASWHRKMCISVLGVIATLPIYLGLIFGSIAMINPQQPQVGPIHFVMWGGVVIAALVMLVFSILLLISYIVLCTKVYETGMAIVMILGYFVGGIIPFLPLILLVMVASKGGSILKAKGYKVGLLGVSPDQLR